MIEIKRVDAISSTTNVVPNANGSGLKTLPPLSIYVHLPWCLKKCPYCDFNSHEKRDALPETDYLRALELDLESSLPGIWGRPIQTIFIGGGTPSLFSAPAIDQLLTSIRARVKLAPDAEVTLEANPGTFEAQRFADYRKAGVTRLSVGVQSFNDQHLQLLGRVHDAKQAVAAAELAGRVYDTWNLDLMYGLPEQSLEQAIHDLQQAIALNPPHLSLYNLTLEPNTMFAAKPPQLPDDDCVAQMQDALQEQLERAGYRRYEVSAWAKPGHESRHNRNYWEFGDYLGIGAGAHSKISSAFSIERQIRWRTPNEYLSKSSLSLQTNPFMSQSSAVEAAELPFEFMLNALRLVDGVANNLFSERTGVSLVQVQTALRDALAKGLLDNDPVRLRATPHGLLFLNELQVLFLA